MVRAVIDVAGVTDAIVGFHAQQAVEKSVKAVLASREHRFPLTHDLLERCGQVDVDVPAELERSAGLLTPYAVRHRYGGRAPDLVDRQTALWLAVLAVEWATARSTPPDPSARRFPGSSAMHLYDLASVLLGGPTGGRRRGTQFRQVRELVRQTFGEC